MSAKHDPGMVNVMALRNILVIIITLTHNCRHWVQPYARTASLRNALLKNFDGYLSYVQSDVVCAQEI
jgi:hypothetical protein